MLVSYIVIRLMWEDNSNWLGVGVVGGAFLGNGPKSKVCSGVKIYSFGGEFQVWLGSSNIVLIYIYIDIDVMRPESWNDMKCHKWVINDSSLQKTSRLPGAFRSEKPGTASVSQGDYGTANQRHGAGFSWWVKSWINVLEHRGRWSLEHVRNIRTLGFWKMLKMLLFHPVSSY